MNGGNLLGDTLGFVIQVLVGLYVLVLMLRLLLGWLRADFYNPLSQFIVKVTNPPVIPLRRLLPPLGRLDTATVVVMLVVQMLGVALVMLVSGRPVHPYPLLAHSLIELISLGFSVFIFAILIQAILSWVNPGGYNPALAILHSLTEPVLRPLRGLIPPISGIDLSPLFAILILEVARRLVLGLLTALLFA
ncbi:hypothetical protein TspCOW1_27740 [Thiohalobacter sp. COW1]|uniref:Integral membrane protein n=1 Tax=Thiohalobacter thiocyanaticus TaxID=585455 RepID=A0A1Z4VUQ9_9GAMM|nr:MULTISPECIES: YggT family protein [Thiohalobacter]BAZ95379.1 integral membrane protein [Thiohalobacter thiocyanaticus]BCO32671.1 hypothetical protein TspCOW1_27740 [Thiohalobacter sp. COW1]